MAAVGEVLAGDVVFGRRGGGWHDGSCSRLGSGSSFSLFHNRRDQPRSARSNPSALCSVSAYSSSGVGVGHDAAADGELHPAAADRERADQDVRVHRAVETDVAETAAVGAARRRFQLGDDLHRPHLRRPVTEPPGNAARNRSTAPSPGRSRPRTSDTR